jgi:hypothetical protein
MVDVYEYNLATDVAVERDFNEEELAQLELDKEAARIAREEEEAKAATKAAVLERLGLTEEELKAVLG